MINACIGLKNAFCLGGQLGNKELIGRGLSCCHAAKHHFTRQSSIHVCSMVGRFCWPGLWGDKSECQIKIDEDKYQVILMLKRLFFSLWFGMDLILPCWSSTCPSMSRHAGFSCCFEQWGWGTTWATSYKHETMKWHQDMKRQHEFLVRKVLLNYSLILFWLADCGRCDQIKASPPALSLAK